jgi:hypothetical protein
MIAVRTLTVSRARSTGGLAALLVAVIVALGTAPPAVGRTPGAAAEGPDPAAAACPADSNADPAIGLHERSIACLASWRLGDDPLPPGTPLSRSTAARLLTDLVVRAGTTLRTPVADPFNDDDGHPDEAALGQLAAVQVLRGRDGNVDPEGRLTRAQLAAVAVRTVQLLADTTLPSVSTPFADVAQSPHREAIAQAYGAGLMAGRTATSFAPSVAATFGQYATVATRMLGMAVTAGLIDAPATPSAPLVLAVTPLTVRDSIPGQHLVLLITLARDDHPEQSPATVTVSADGATVSPTSTILAGSDVREIVVAPAALAAAASEEQPVEARVPVVVTVARGDTRHRSVVTLRVTPGTDELEPAAREHLQRWVGWLAAEHPELGIGRDTAWTPSIVQPHILVVSHYLYFSPDWELGLTWHVMIPPHDWSRIYLRPRDEVAPALGFELPSVSDPTSIPREIEPPPEVDR